MTARAEQSIRTFGLFAVLFLVSAVGYWRVLAVPEKVLAFNDGNIEAVLSPTFQFPKAMLRVWDNTLFAGLGMGQYPLSVTGIGESVFGAHHWRREGQAVVLALCGMAFYWLLRQHRFSHWAGAIAAGVVMMSGFCTNFAMQGLAVRPMALGFSAMALGFVERGRRSDGWLSYAVAGGFLGLAVAEVPDVGALFALTTAVVFWWTHVGGEKTSAKRWAVLAGKFALYAACSFLLAFQTVSLAFSTWINGVKQAGGSEAPDAQYAWATQWSIPPSESWNIVAGNYFGSSIRSETSPYWGRLGRSDGWEITRQGFRNFAGCGWHFGVVPVALLLMLWGWRFQQKKSAIPDDSGRPQTLALLVFVGCATTLMLMWGKYFPLYRLVYALPYFHTIRSPEKWNGPFILFGGIGVAWALDNLLAKRDENSAAILRRVGTWVALGLAGLSLLILLNTFTSKATILTRLQSEGYGALATVAWSNSLWACLKVIALALAFAGILRFVLGKSSLTPSRRTGILVGGIALLSLGDLWYDNHFYVQSRQYSQYFESNSLVKFLDEHRNDGRLKLLPMEHPVLNTLRQTLLQIKGYDCFDPIAMSRLPSDYETFFKAFGRNPIPTWEMLSVRYFLTLPGAADQLNALDGNRGRFREVLATGIKVVNETYIPDDNAPAERKALRLVEFTGALPRHRFIQKPILFPNTEQGQAQAIQLVSSTNFPFKDQAVISANNSFPPEFSTNGQLQVVEESANHARIQLKLASPALLLRAVKNDPNWIARLDGQPIPVMTANYLLQSVSLPAGEHILEFDYKPSSSGLTTAATGRALLIVGLLGLCLYNKESP